jgi:hypothetical protein
MPVSTLVSFCDKNQTVTKYYQNDRGITYLSSNFIDAEILGC